MTALKNVVKRVARRHDKVRFKARQPPVIKVLLYRPTATTRWLSQRNTHCHTQRGARQEERREPRPGQLRYSSLDGVSPTNGSRRLGSTKAVFHVVAVAIRVRFSAKALLFFFFTVALLSSPLPPLCVCRSLSLARSCGPLIPFGIAVTRAGRAYDVGGTLIFAGQFSLQYITNEHE